MEHRLLKTTLLVVFIILSFCSVCAQEVSPYNLLIDFNRQLNFYYFEQLRAYILNNGDKKTYCPAYKDNPHYKVEDLSTDIYLNPTNKDAREPSENDYNVMYLVEDQSGKLIHYYLYLSPQRDVFLYDYDKQFVDRTMRKQSVEHLEGIIEKILKKAGIN